ncbi:MAG: type II secretion system protein N [Pseudomonadota bacterium]
MTTVFKRRLILAATLLFVIGLIAKLPARVAFAFAPDTVQTRGITGTLWNGRVQAVDVQGVRAGPINWTLKPLSLFTGALAASVECGLPNGFFDGDITVRASSIRIDDAKVSVSLADVTRNFSIGPSTGEVSGRIDTLLLKNQWPTRADAALNLRALSYPAVGPDALGSYRLVFDSALADERWPVVGELTSVDGPYAVDGTLSLGDGRAYSMQADVTPTAEATQRLKDALRLLGPAAADGSHALVFDGNL